MNYNGIRKLKDIYVHQTSQKRTHLKKTPHMVFTRTHKEFVTNAEKWMKATAGSCTVIAALITAIVFIAAVTVPGGNNKDTGVPFVTNNPALVCNIIYNIVIHSPNIIVSVLVHPYSTLIPIAALITCLPVTSFVILQFPLVANLTSATYGRTIFGRKVSRSYSKPFYV